MRSSHARLALLLTLFPLCFPIIAYADNSSLWVVPGGGAVGPPAEFGLAKSQSRSTIGGIVGLKLAPPLALEGRISRAKPDLVSARTLVHYDGNLTWFLAKGRLAPYLTAGAGQMRRKADTSSVSVGEFAWNGGAGFRLGFSDHVSLRADLRDVSYKVAAGDGDKFRHSAEIFGGLSLGFGGRSKDSDGDGVSDKKDDCPGTPAGARVDPKGCPSDSDKDGILDGLDQCPDTPAGATVNAQGCPNDSDKDGVLDGLDKCPDTPTGARVDIAGCPLDSDGDGIFDGLDQCENTQKGCTVTVQGCPTDTDGDGICDGLDRCPDTPVSARVDSKGCPIVVSEKETQLLETGMIRLQDVNFDTGKSTIKEESHAVLDDVGNILARWPELRIEIGGHTDSQGGDALNQRLSEDRAKAVLDYMTGKFPSLKAEQFTTAGYGETKPIASDKTVLGRAKNRRVEFKVLNTDVLKRVQEQQKMAPKQ